MELSSVYLRLPDIRKWAEDRNLIAGSTPTAQYVKLLEEIGELVSAMKKGDKDGTKDGVGDGFVVLTILAAQCGYQLEQYLDQLPLFDMADEPTLVSLGDLAAAIARGKHDQVMAPLMRVANSLYCTAFGARINVKDCVEHAWAQIKDRKGRMVNGVFVKEGD